MAQLTQISMHMVDLELKMAQLTQISMHMVGGGEHRDSWTEQL
jgi:hypothetical protein